MTSLEHRARQVVENQDARQAAAFLADVAYLKQPYSIERGKILTRLLDFQVDIAAALKALRDVERLDYSAMDVLARVPRFGRKGGRSFNSAVFRLVAPKRFGIIDWRNVAVLVGANGFGGLIRPPVVFGQFAPETVLQQRGHLPFTMDVYRQYNDALRALAIHHARTVAEIDLILWTYSFRCKPFPKGIPLAFSSQFALTSADREALRHNREPVTKRMVEGYLTRLKETGVLSREGLVAELCSVLSFIRNECKEFGYRKHGRIKDRIHQIVMVLDDTIASRDPGRLLSLWTRWQDMVDPSSPKWIGIDLPGDMVLKGYMVLEDFIPVKHYIESFYDSQLEPSYPCD